MKFKYLILEHQAFNMNHVFAKFVLKLLEKKIKIRIGSKDFVCDGFSYNDLFSIVEYPISKWNIYMADGNRLSSLALRSQIDAAKQLYKLFDSLKWKTSNIPF